MKTTSALSKHGVAGVSGVQANSHAGLSCNPKKISGVSGVADTPETELSRQIDSAQPPSVSVPLENRPTYAVYESPVVLEQSGAILRPGVWYHGANQKGDAAPELVDSWICSPLHIDAQTHDQQGNNYGRLLRFVTSTGQERRWAMPMEMLAGSGEEYRRELLAMGMRIDPKNRSMLGNYLNAQTPPRVVRCAMQVGWHGDEFVLPDEVIGPDPESVIFQATGRYLDEYTRAGTLEEWREQIAALASGNPLLLLPLSAAFAGPLLARCNAEGGGIHLVGDSSTGKSTALEAARSVWGGRGYLKSWKATANGMEGAAAMHNDGLLCLDEISECNPREVGAIVYSLGNGIGKQRAGRSGAARSITRWRCIVVSSGERAISTQMAEAGHKTKAGQTVRLLDIPATRSHGAWDELHGYSNGQAFSDSIKHAAARHYGEAGRAFLKRLTADDRDFPEYLDALRREITPDDAEGQEKRAAARFALLALAGELATEYGITGWTEGAATEAAKEGFRLWREFRGRGNDEQQRIVSQLREFIERHGDSRFSSRDAGEVKVSERAGWWEERDGCRIYLLNSAGMREALAGFDFKRALDALETAGVIPAAPADGKRARFHRIGGRGMKLYEIDSCALEGEQ